MKNSKAKYCYWLFFLLFAVILQVAAPIHSFCSDHTHQTETNGFEDNCAACEFIQHQFNESFIEAGATPLQLQVFTSPKGRIAIVNQVLIPCDKYGWINNKAPPVLV